jgi:hypothetical protein
MAKFLDKKEQVIDFQLTPYGKHRLSVGQLRPAFYAFFDTGIAYDSEYSGFKESQNNIHERIKNETHFIEGVLLFEEAENSVPPSTFIGEASSAMSADGMPTGPISQTSLFDLDVVPQRYVPKPEILSFDSAIGDARFEGDNIQAAPAWKVVACQGEMSNIRTRDTTQYNVSPANFDQEITEFNVPQIDVDAFYTLLISSPSDAFQEETISDFVSETSQFAGGNTIKLVRDDIMIYGEEVNTELLTENFDVEVFEIIEDAGTVVQATGIIKAGSNAGAIAVGDTITISDGISSTTFEFIENNRAARNAAINAVATNPRDRVYVVVSDNYIFDSGTNFNRKGTIYNLISALRQDNGYEAAGYPTNSRQNDAGDTSKGRCKATVFGNFPGCYVGGHNLNLSINRSVITDLRAYSFGSSSEAKYPIVISNTNTTIGNPNQLMTTTAAAARIKTVGFGGDIYDDGLPSGPIYDGYVRKGIELKRKYFNDANPQIVDGLMTVANPEAVPQPDLTTDAVEFFFDLLTDSKANGKIACNCANTFNKNSYYVDVDFDCTEEELDEVYYDIYGSATAPEICDLPPTTVQELRDLQPTEGPCEDE